MVTCLAGRRKIQDLKVKCNNMNSECEWEGIVGTLAEHVAMCEFALVPCPKQCKDSDEKVEYFTKINLNEHLKNDCPDRDYECEHCGEKGTYTNITDVHDKKCEKKLVPCSNADCTDTIQRQAIERHLEDCIHTEVSCKYQKIGCDVKMKRNAMSGHEDGKDKLHLHMGLDAIVTMKAKKTTTFKFSEFQSWVSEFQSYKNRNDYKAYNIYTSPSGCSMKLIIFPNGLGDDEGTHVAVKVFLSGSLYESNGTITCEVLNQLEDKNHCIKTIELNGHLPEHVNLIAHSELAHDPIRNTQYLEGDTLFFRVSVEMADYKPWLQCTS